MYRPGIWRLILLERKEALQDCQDFTVQSEAATWPLLSRNGMPAQWVRARMDATTPVVVERSRGDRSSHDP
jgi:hypothetical protein